MGSRRCPSCSGSGRYPGTESVYDPSGGYMWKSVSVMKTCSHCGGSGTVWAPDPVATPSRSRGRSSTRNRAASAAPPKPSPTALFAERCADAVSKKTAGAFAWVPRWVGTTIKTSLAAGGFAWAFGYGGWILALGGAGLGWLTPRLTLGLAYAGVYLTFALLYVAWHLTIACAVLGCIALLSYAFFHLLTP